MSDCVECNNKRYPWSECDGCEWYAPSDIERYCPYQIVWLLDRPHYNLLNQGIWIPNPEHMEKVQQSFSHKAYYEVTMQIIGEVNRRLRDSKVYHKRWFLDAISGVEYKELYGETRDMVNYLSGRYPRVDSYAKWKSKKTYRNKIKNLTR